MKRTYETQKINGTFEVVESSKPSTAMKLSTKLGVFSATALASASSFANQQITDSLTAAITAGQSNYTLVVVGVIGLAAIAFGLARVLGILK